ncbi:uncharacterized protein [Elaeis guineensis]
MSSLRSHGKVELQGPRPAHLMIRNETRRIRKPARNPVIIYVVSPKIIHAEASEFMALVQRLTGLPASRPCGESSATHHQSTPGSTRPFPVRVKARVLTHDPVSPNPMHDSSPPSSFGVGARKVAGSLQASQSYSGPGPGLPSPNYVPSSPNYLDVISEAEAPAGHNYWYKEVGELFFRD